MIFKNMKKILSSILLVNFIALYTAPMGLCITTNNTNTSKMNLAVQKPVLRSSSASNVLKLEGDILLSKANPKVNLSLRDSDVKQVLRMFADKAGLNIIFHDSVAGKVTLDLVNVPLNDAFKMVLQVTNLTYFIDKNTLVITSSAAASSLNLAKEEITVIPVKYVDAVAMADFLNKNIFSLNRPGLSNTNIVTTNPATNELLVFGTDNDAKMAKKIVAQFDKKPTEQTYIVNHITPKEMSDLICKTLFKAQSVTSTSTSSYGTTQGQTNSNGQMGTNGQSGNTNGQSTGMPGSSTNPMQQQTNSTNKIPGTITGGADALNGSVSSSSSSSSTSTSSSSTSTSSVPSLTLGAGAIACQYNNSIATGTLNSLSLNNLIVTYFSQRGTISVIGGSDAQRDLIKEFIQKYDKKMPQAYLEVSIIELTEDGIKQFDNTWEMYSNFFSGTFSSAGLATNSSYLTYLQGDSYTIPGKTTSTTSGGVTTISQAASTLYSQYTGAPTITYAINYLLKNTKGRVLANPKILITNGQASTIDLSSDYIKSVTSQIITGSTSLSNPIQKTYNIGSDEGIKVTMTPFISPSGYVTLNITPNYATEKSQVYDLDSSGNKELAVTLLQRRNLDLKNIRIKDGETLVIGGMIQETETKSTEKIPLLGDLPGIGVMFRSTDTEKTKTEMVLMITPKIVQDSEDVVNNQNTNNNAL